MHCAQRLISLAALALLAAGCQSQTTPSTKIKPLDGAPIVTSPEEKKILAESLTDPCALRLQTIGNMLASFYSVYRAFPSNLEMLRPLAAAKWGVQLQFTCPESNKPYLYVPAGLAAPGNRSRDAQERGLPWPQADDARRLVVYDATAAHHGWRWGIVFPPPPRGVVYLSPELVPINEKGLQEAVAAAAAPPPASPSAPAPGPAAAPTSVAAPAR